MGNKTTIKEKLEGIVSGIADDFCGDELKKEWDDAFVQFVNDNVDTEEDDITMDERLYN